MMGTLQSDNYVMIFLLFFTDGVYFGLVYFLRYIMDNIKQVSK